MHKHTLSLLTLIISAATLHNNTQAAFRRLPVTVQSMRSAMRQHTTFTRSFSSQATPPHKPTRQTGSGRSFDGYVGSAAALIMAGNFYLMNEIGRNEYEILESEKRQEKIRQALKEEEIRQAIESDQLSDRALKYALRETSRADIFAACFKKTYASQRFFALAEFIERAPAAEIRILWDSHRAIFDENLLPLFWLAAATKKGITAEDLQKAHIAVDAPCGGLKMTPLYRATLSRDKETVQGLLKAGADTNAKSAYEQVALFAAIYGSIGPWASNSDANSNYIVKALLAAGADVNAQNHVNKTALHAAVGFGKGRETCVVTLLEAGADVNAVTDFQDTPLHYACMASIPSVTTVWLLLQHGAHVRARNFDDKLPADLCHDKPNAYAIRALLAASAFMQQF